VCHSSRLSRNQENVRKALRRGEEVRGVPEDMHDDEVEQDYLAWEGLSIGSITLNVLPFPSSLSTSILP
jgi:hypothetical protein